MIKKITPYCLLTFFLLVQFTFGQNQNPIRVKDKIIFIDNGQKFETNLFDLKYIGQIQNDTKKYLILGGRQCNECDANISLYIISTSDGPLKNESEQERYSYPGKLYDYFDNSLIAEYRTFYGEVLKGKIGVIWCQKELDSENKWIESTFLLTLINNKLVFDTIASDLNLTLEQVKNKKAFEIIGIDSTSEP